MDDSNERLLPAGSAGWIVFGCAIIGIGAHFLPLFDLNNYGGLLARMGASPDVKILRIYQAPWAIFTIPLFLLALLYALVRSAAVARTFSFVAGMGVILVLGYYIYIYWFYPLEFITSLLGKRDIPKLPAIFTVERIRNLIPGIEPGNYLIAGAALAILASSLLAPEEENSDETSEEGITPLLSPEVEAESNEEPQKQD